MAYIKQIERSGCVTFAPHASLLACGTAAGAIDLSFSSNSVLEIFPVDLTSQNEFHALGGAIPVHERFNRLAWGHKPAESLSLPMGVLAGGLADGSIYVWDPAVIAGDPAKTGKNPVLAKLQKHTGPVKGLQFNTFSPNLLASGAADGDLCIWDIANPAAPSLYPALKGATPTAPGRQEPEITHLAWNPRVQHILASTTAAGSTVVWDLKKQRPVLSFRDPTSQRRCSVLHWHPDEARQLIVASDDDRSPTLQMWDLRNSATPLKEFVGHTKGVLGMDWCPHDSSLLLSCGKDSRTICWDTATAEIVCELPTSNDWHVDVQWSPSTPGVFAASSYDSKVGFCNLATCTVSQMVETVNADFTVTKTAAGSTPLKRAPAWMKRPAGVAFGFGGRLVSFAHHKQQQQDAAGQLHTVDAATISVRQVISEQELVQHSEAFERAISGGDRSALKDFCAAKAAAPPAAAAAPEEAETWAFLSVLFEDDARRQLLQQLGFADALAALPAAAEEAAADGVVAGMDGLQVAEGAPPAAAPPAEDPFAAMNDESFFDNLAEQPKPAPPAPAADGPSSHPPSPTAANHVAEADGDHSGAEADIQRALFVGNYALAVEACVKAERWADALLVANTCSSELYKKTMQRYMLAIPRPYMRIIGAMVDNDFLALVKTRPVGAWRETLAILATYTGPEQWMELCDALAARLAAAGMLHPASLCYICAGNVEQAVAYWSRVTKAGTVGVDVLQSVIEKAVVIGLATNNRQASASLSDLVTSYATILACEGRVGTALEYLDLVPGEASSTVAVLRDRIYRCGVPGVPNSMNPPPFPFVREEVQASAQAPATNAYSNNSYSQQQPAAYGSSYAAATPAYSTPSYQTAATAAANNTYGSSAYTTGAAATAYASAAQAAPAPQAYTSSPYATPSTYQTQGTAASAYNYQTAGATSPSYAAQAYNASAAPPAQTNYSYGAASATPTYAPPSNEGSVYTVAKRTAAAPPPQANPTNTYVTAANTAPPVAPAVPPPPQPNVFTPSAPSAAPPGQTATVPPPAAFAPIKAAAPPPIPAATNNVPPPPNSGNANYPGMMVPQQAPQQPPSPKPQPPPTPAAPPPNTTIQTADTSKVPTELKPVVKTFTSLFTACLPAASNAVKKREMDDNSKRLGQLFWKLNAGEVSPAVAQKLQQLCAALDRADWGAASHIQVEMTTTNWDECGTWLSAVKRLIKTRQMLG